MACWPMGVGRLEYRMSEEGIIALFPQTNISAHPGKLDCPLKTRNLPLDDNLLVDGYLAHLAAVHSAPCPVLHLLKDRVVWGAKVRYPLH